MSKGSFSGSIPLVLLLTFLSSGLDPTRAASEAPEAAWSEPVDGLRVRLVSDRDVYEEGQYVWLHLDVLNTTDKAMGLAWGAVCDKKDERIQALIKPLSDPDAEFRATAAEMLAYIGPAAEQAIPDLERLAANDDDPNVRREAREALEKIRK